jgi:hypothetical protein
MKTLLYLIAAVGVLGIATPSYAAPPFFHQRRIVNYLPGGVPVYATYQIVGYDGLGRPIYQWVNQPVSPAYGYRPTYLRPYNGGHIGHWGHWNHGGHVSHGGGHGHGHGHH